MPRAIDVGRQPRCYGPTGEELRNDLDDDLDDLEEDDDTNLNDDGNTALLSSNTKQRRFEASPTKIWPQVKSIVIEVCE